MPSRMKPNISTGGGTFFLGGVALLPRPVGTLTPSRSSIIVRAMNGQQNPSCGIYREIIG